MLEARLRPAPDLCASLNDGDVVDRCVVRACTRTGPSLALRAGFEPARTRLTAGRSSTELPQNECAGGPVATPGARTMKAFSNVKEHAPRGVGMARGKDSLSASSASLTVDPIPRCDEHSEEQLGRRDSNPRYLGQNQASWPLSDSRMTRTGVRIYAH